MDLAQAFLAALDERGKLEWSRAFLDGSFVPAKKGEEVGLTKVGKWTKRMLTIDRWQWDTAFPGACQCQRC